MAQAILSSEASGRANKAGEELVNASAISWPAIFAGAIAAAALSLILILLGTGLGLSSISPWSHSGVDGTAFGIAAIIWISVTQILAAGMGGYLTGRLRVKWAETHTDEVYFRDTAHGFLAWAVATLVTAVFLTSAIGAAVNASVQATTNLVGGAAKAGGIAAMHEHAGKGADPKHAKNELAYFVDSLFRKKADSTANNATDKEQPIPSAEVTRIFANAIAEKSLPAEDATYVAQVISSHTGLTQQEAEQRVNDTYHNIQTKLDQAEKTAKEAADKARKASVYITLWLFISLLLGAFSASLTATWGGCGRDA
jgi:hypothetical protein